MAAVAAFGWAALLAVLDRQRGALFPWVPVLLGLGIGLYFVAPAEPSAPQLWLAGGCVLLLPLAWIWRAAAGPLLLIPVLIGFGFWLAGMRAQTVAAPVLDFRYHGPVEGRIVSVDRSASGLVRLTLDRVVLERVVPGRVPARVRISLRGQQDWLRAQPGAVILTTASLSGPEPPVIPGGFDFRRHAWFLQLGAIGYTASPVLMIEDWQPGELWLARLRQQLSEDIRRQFPGQPGAFAAAILTGDDSAVDAETMEALRVSSLVHILSISGLHMVLLCGAVFWWLRLMLALVPGLALRWPIRKWAALGALAMGAFYYLLSGGAIPAERAWVMIAVMFGAVLLDRKAISVRSLAVAGCVVLVLRPESLVDAGFQMSFAATLALVSVFGELMPLVSRLPRWANAFGVAVLSSAVAGGASAPFAAAHFNRFSDYGLIANVLATPLMGLAVMPLCVVWMLALPFGLGGPVLWLMGKAIEGILVIGHVVTALPGAYSMIPTPGALVLPLLSLAGLMLALWRGPGRIVGAAGLGLSLLLWSQTLRPDLLISASGGLIGQMTPAGRAFSKPGGDSYAARQWLLDDGDRASQAEAAGRPGPLREAGQTSFSLEGLSLVQTSGRGAAQRALVACRTADLVVTSAEVDKPPCPIWDSQVLARTGALAIWLTPEGPRVETVSQRHNGRLWSPGPRLALPLGAPGPEGRHAAATVVVSPR